MKKIFYILALFNLILLTCYAQPSITWQRLYNGPESKDDESYAICKADSSNLYIAGYTFFDGYRRVYVLKINPYGDTIWTRIIPVNGTGGIANAIVRTEDGGCVVTGEKNYVKFLIHLDRNGNIVWQYTYSSSVNVDYYDIKRAFNEDYICSGFYQNGGTSLRIDTLGNVIYDKLYPNLFYQFHSLQPTTDNGCLIAGYTVPNQAMVVKLDSNGNITNTKYFNVNNNETIAFSFEKDNNKYILSGNYWNGTKDIPYFIKLDSNLNPLDTHIFTQVNDEIAHAMKVLPNGKYVWTFCDYTTFGFNRFLITDDSGNILHDTIKYTNFSSQEFFDICPIDNGDIIFTGYAEFNATSPKDDIYAIRTDSLLNFPPNIIGIKQNGSSIPKTFVLYQNYPNPFNPVTKIKFSIPTLLNPPFGKGGRTQSGGFVTLKIYDILGREVAVLVNQQLSPGTYEVEFDGSNYPSGVYFYRLTVTNASSPQANPLSITKKMVLVK